MKRRKLWVPSILLGLSILLNIMGRLWRNFADSYVNYVFPLWVTTYGRITGLFPFSIGEWMLYTAVVLIAILAVAGMIRVAWHRQVPLQYKHWYGKYMMFVFWTFSVVCFIMTLNCFLLYQSTPITQRYKIGDGSKTKYGLEEITILRDYAVEQANALSVRFARDEKGYILYEGDMVSEAKRQMQNLGQQFPSLRGYYPNPKELMASGFYSQQCIMGYYFPFSMEANYNGKMYVTNKPVTLCHELSHLKGFILEDEANFIGYLACVDSQDELFQYSAYLSVVGYLNWDFMQALGKDGEEIYDSHPQLNQMAYEDTRFLTQEAWDTVEENAVLDTETVKAATDTFLETTLTLNGVEDGTISYSRVVELLLEYYDGILY